MSPAILEFATAGLLLGGFALAFMLLARSLSIRFGLTRVGRVLTGMAWLPLALLIVSGLLALWAMITALAAGT